MKFIQKFILLSVFALATLNIAFGQSNSSPVPYTPSILADAANVNSQRSRPIETKQFDGNPNEQELMELTVLQDAQINSTKFKIPVLIKLKDCQKKCAPIQVSIDHTTIVQGSISLRGMSKDEKYVVVSFKTQLDNRARLAEIVFQ